MLVGPLSSWQKTMGMAPPVGQFRRERHRDRQTGRDDEMSGISNSLTGNASDCKGIRRAKTSFRNPVWGWNFLLRGLM